MRTPNFDLGRNKTVLCRDYHNALNVHTLSNIEKETSGGGGSEGEDLRASNGTARRGGFVGAAVGNDAGGARGGGAVEGGGWGQGGPGAGVARGLFGIFVVVAAVAPPRAVGDGRARVLRVGGVVTRYRRGRGHRGASGRGGVGGGRTGWCGGLAGPGGQEVDAARVVQVGI